MSSLETTTMRNVRARKKTVQKRRESGRCYNYIQGSGWNHYTKGFKKHSTLAEVLEKGSMFLFSFLDRINPKTEEVKGE